VQLERRKDARQLRPGAVGSVAAERLQVGEEGAQALAVDLRRLDLPRLPEGGGLGPQVPELLLLTAPLT
jgi:hypothetical protein